MIETERLKLYAASREAMEAFIDLQTVDVLKTAYREMLAACLAHSDQWEWYAIWMIEEKNGAHVGELCFKGVNDGVVEIGYGIVDAFRGCGYAAEAVSAAVSWALRQPGVTCVEAECEADNAASRRVLEKSGFEANGAMGAEGPRYAKYRS